MGEIIEIVSNVGDLLLAFCALNSPNGLAIAPSKIHRKLQDAPRWIQTFDNKTITFVDANPTLEIKMYGLPISFDIQFNF